MICTCLSRNDKVSPFSIQFLYQAVYDYAIIRTPISINRQRTDSIILEYFKYQTWKAENLRITRTSLIV
jgi:hypothetical protein